MSEARWDTLPNGLRVVTEAMPDCGTAAIGVWIEAGGRHETAEENGVAHFLEHMAFKGTDARSARDIAVEIENVGGYLNAYTGREATAYYARVLAEDAPLALDIIADILRRPRFADGDVELERGVILQEIGLALDTPDDIIFDWVQEAAFPDQPLGRPILGPAEGVSRYGAADLRRFVAAHYRPARMMLAAAGGVRHDDVLRMAERLFGDMQPAPAPATAPARFSPGERRETRKLEQAHLALNFQAPAYADPTYPAAQLYATAMGGGMSSRLFQEAREKRGLCYAIFASLAGYEDAGCLTVYAGTGGAEARGLVELVIDEMRRAPEGLSQDELERARAQLRASMVMGMESVSNRAERLARTLSVWGRVPTLDEQLARIERIDLNGLRAYAAGLAAPAVALYGPVGDAPGAEEIAARLAA